MDPYRDQYGHVYWARRPTVRYRAPESEQMSAHRQAEEAEAKRMAAEHFCGRVPQYHADLGAAFHPFDRYVAWLAEDWERLAKKCLPAGS